MRHRIFIAINLPENVKSQLFSYKSKWPELPARWTKKENLHITLVFLGYVKDEELMDILEAVRTAAAKSQPFLISLKRICYGPNDKKPPRMIWAEGEKSIELAKLQQEIENALGEKIAGFQREVRAFSPHITLARIKTWELRRMEPEEKPEISEDISLNFDVNSVEVMESVLKPKGPDYFALESMELGKK